MVTRVLLPGMFFFLALMAGIGMYAFSGSSQEVNPLRASQGSPRPVSAGGGSTGPAPAPVTALDPAIHGAPAESGVSGLTGRAESRQGTLYVISKVDPTKLVAFQTTLDSAPGARDLVDRVIQTLQGPFEDPNVLPTIPKGTKLLSVFVMRKQLIVNLSRELAMAHPGGTQNARLTIYSIVNSLVDLGLGEEVKILIQGREEMAFMDHMDLSRSLPFEASVISNKQIAQAPSAADTTPGGKAVQAISGTAAAAGGATSPR